jgi:pyruvate formate lyase activating enzyme
VVEIKGLEKFAPKDFPGFISSTVFLAGCNFRCPYCHNSDLIERPETLAPIPPDFFLAYLDARKGWLEGICVSGGEPLAAAGLEELLGVIKERGLLIKIDTNGSFPGRLTDLIEEGLVDHVAMDIKASPERYPEVVQRNVKVEDVRLSAEIVRTFGVEYMFRTTVVPGLVEEEDIAKIANWLDGAKIFQIQQFSPLNTLDPEYAKIKPFAPDRLQRMADIARPHFGEVRVEGG